MTQSFEDQVRERAYHIWMSDGMAHGLAHEHWISAERAMMSEHAQSNKPSKVHAKATKPKAATASAKRPSTKPKTKTATPKMTQTPAANGSQTEARITN